MATEEHTLEITISTLDGEDEMYTYSWRNTTIGQTRSEMMGLVGLICRHLAEPSGIIHISPHGIAYNSTNVAKVRFQASSEDLQEEVNRTISRVSGY